VKDELQGRVYELEAQLNNEKRKNRELAVALKSADQAAAVAQQAARNATDTVLDGKGGSGIGAELERSSKKLELEVKNLQASLVEERKRAQRATVAEKELKAANSEVAKAKELLDHEKRAVRQLQQQVAHLQGRQR